MLNRSTADRNLIDLLIRALSDDVAEQQTNNVGSSRHALQTEMKEAIYELRLRKLALSALVGTGRSAERTARH